MKIGTNEEYLFQNTKTTKFHETTFSKYFSFDIHGDVLNPNMAQKIAQNRISYTNDHRKIKVKGTLRWGILLWNYFLEILKF